MELWDIYDTNRNKTGKIMNRTDSFEVGEYHLVVHACVFNKENKMLIQQRHAEKDSWASYWDISVGGSAQVNETSQVATQRELYEELGLEVNLEDVRAHLSVNYAHGFDDVYLIELDVDVNELSIQKDEVQAIKWASLEEIFELLEEGVFIPYHKSLIQLFFDMRGKYGVLTKEQTNK